MQKRKSIKIILIAFIILVIAGYTYYQSRALISGPEVTVESPPDGESFNDSLVKIKGNAKNIIRLSLNDKTIFIDEKGAFNEKLLIYKGLNIIEIKAEDKFGRTKNKILRLVLK
jgi:hypothetical protein